LASDTKSKSTLTLPGDCDVMSSYFDFSIGSIIASDSDGPSWVLGFGVLFAY